MIYGLYVAGKKVGDTTGEVIDGHLVATKDYKGRMIADAVKTLKAAALKDGINLTVGSGLRTQEEQIAIRKAYVKDISKINNTEWILTAPSSEFYPVAAPPGFSNHQNGSAIDWNVTNLPKVYEWIVKNGHAYGWVRTVKSERWHWEYIPGLNQFALVPKTDPTWDGLV